MWKTLIPSDWPDAGYYWVRQTTIHGVAMFDPTGFCLPGVTESRVLIDETIGWQYYTQRIECPSRRIRTTKERYELQRCYIKD